MNRIRLFALTTAVTSAVLALVLSASPALADKNSSFCKQAVKMDKLGNTLDSADPTKDVKKAQKAMGDLIKQLKTLEDKAPSKVKSDLKDVRSVMDDYRKALSVFESIDPKKPDAKKAADAVKKMQPVLDKINKLQPSMDRVTKYLTTECGIKP